MSIYSNVIDHPMTIYIDSSERVSGSNESFLSAPIIISATNSYDSVVVSQVSIPKSWYNVPSLFNYIDLVENGNTTRISIPPGNYNRNNMALVLSSLMTSGSLLGKTYNMTYSNIAVQADTGKYTFSYTPVLITDVISIQIDGVSLFQQLGFERNSLNTYNGSGVLVSTNIMNFQIVSSIFITSDMCVEEGTLQELHNVGITQSNAYIYFQQIEFDLTSKQLLTKSNNSWNFSISDEFERPIDLNGVPYELSLILYNRSDLHQLQKDQLKIENLEKLLENELKIKNI